MNVLRENRFAFFLVFITFAAFFRKFFVPFMWDDFPFILHNEYIQDISNIGRYFYEDIARLYRPLRQVMYTLSYFLFGEAPLGYHLFGLLLHIGVVLTLFACLNRIFENRFLNFLAALLFALHPIHAERVLLITGSFDILGDLLTLIAFYLYLLSTKEEATNKRTWSLLVFFLALLSSENAVILLPLILIYELIFGKASFWNKSFFMTFLPYIGVFFAYFFIRSITLEAVARTGETENYLSLLFSMPQVFLQYLHVTFFPINLSVYRAPQLPDPDFLLTNILSCGVILLLIIIGLRKKSPQELRFALLWFFVCLIPVSNIVPTGTIMEERYLYLPSFAFSLVILSFCTFLKHQQRLLYGFLSAVSVIFFVLLFHKSSFYLDEKTKWLKDVQTFEYLYPAEYEDELRKEAESLDLNNPLNKTITVKSVAQASVFFNAANSVRDENNCKSAEELYRISLVLNPLKIPAWHNLYGCFWKEGRIKEVMEGIGKLAYDSRTKPEIKVDLLLMFTSQLINEGNQTWRNHINTILSLPLSEKRKFEVFRNIGIGVLREHRFHEAWFFFQKALEIQEDPSLRNRVAELEKALGITE